MWSSWGKGVQKYAPHVNEASDDNASKNNVEVRRSPRRRRTVSAYWQGSTIVVAIPARYTKAQEREAVAEMVAKLHASLKRRRPSDKALIAMAGELSMRYLEGKAQPASVSWYPMSSQWGSCTMEDRSIRLSTRLQGMPTYVQEYVLVHELAHLLVAEHSPAFWELVAAYPEAERAKGYLEGWSEAKDLPEISDI